MSLPTHPVPDPHADPLVASVLRADERAAAGACPDAELLAMYAERELGDGEHAQVETHVHGCARCQAMVAALVRALPDASAGPGAELEAARRGGFAAWFSGWRWLVPAASLTAVAVVAVWVGRGPADEIAESSRIAGRVAEGENFVRPRPSRVDPAPLAPPLAAGTEARVGGAPAAKTLEQGYRGRQAAPVEAPAAPRAAAEAQERAAAAADARTETSGLVGGSAEGAARGARPVAPAAPEQRADNDTARMREPAAAAPPPPPPAAIAPPAPTRSADPVFRANVAAASWRVSRGVVERSRDGVAWERVATPAGVTVIAVASVSADVGWAITTDAVFIATNGVTWTRATPPPAGPLTNVSATSARAATVTAGGTRFVTTDGGATWAPAQ